MVGLCGIFGDETWPINRITNSICWLNTHRSSTYDDGDVSIGYADHQSQFKKQPSFTGDVSVWCWGEILGHEYKGKYTPKENHLSNSEYCKNIYDKLGLNFVAGLNSEFSGVVYNSESKTISLFTDRLGSRPIYYSRTSKGGIVFSSLLQSLAVHPNIDLKLDPEHLEEFFTYNRVFGVHTPVEGVKKIPPASIFTFDLTGELISEQKYWWPNPTKKNYSFSDTVEKFRNVFSKAVSERISDDQDEGLLLSGGTDSRLLLDSLGDDVISFHMNERLEGNKEAQTAKKVADSASKKFEFLERDKNYYPSIFGEASNITNFNGTVQEAHTVGFIDEITGQVDTLFSGQYSDTVLGGEYVPKKFATYPLISHLYPFSKPRPIDSPMKYSDALSNSEIGNFNNPLPYLGREKPKKRKKPELKERSGGRVINNGVVYGSWPSLVEYGMIYPITNVKTFTFYETSNQILPTKYPFLDNRIVDLALEIPDQFRCQGNIVEVALSNANPDLASIPHPEYNLSTNSSYYRKYYAKKLNSLRSTLSDSIWSDDGYNSVNDGGPWPNHAALIRTHPFVSELLETHEEEIRSSPHLDYTGALKCYYDHLDGSDNTNQIYTLITVLESSLRTDC